MGWRDAFFAQARSEQALRQQLNVLKVEYSHQLHYLQMVTEKLAKSYASHPNSTEAPATSHAVFVRLLQAIKGRPDLRRKLGYENADVFAQFINSLLPLADKIQRLAPNFAGTTNPNPEYPWRDQATNEVIAPVDFEFSDFGPKLAQMIELERLIDAMVRLGV